LQAVLDHRAPRVSVAVWLTTARAAVAGAVVASVARVHAVPAFVADPVTCASRRDVDE
jgi:hypothetical protein